MPKYNKTYLIIPTLECVIVSHDGTIRRDFPLEEVENYASSRIIKMIKLRKNLVELRIL